MTPGKAKRLCHHPLIRGFLTTTGLTILESSISKLSLFGSDSPAAGQVGIGITFFSIPYLCLLHLFPRPGSFWTKNIFCGTYDLVLNIKYKLLLKGPSIYDVHKKSRF